MTDLRKAAEAAIELHPGELLPCPFCGGQAEKVEIGEDEPDNTGGSVVCCKKCQASSAVEFNYKENLEGRWNARAANPHAILDLLDERDALTARVAELERENGMLRGGKLGKVNVSPLGHLSQDEQDEISARYDRRAAAAMEGKP